MTAKLATLLGLTAILRGAPVPPPEMRELTRAIYGQLIGIDTTTSTGDTTAAARAMAERLRQAGMPAADLQVLGPVDKRGNLVARLHGSGPRKPLLLLAHLDVVDARREDWTLDPFVLTEKDGYFYGRGTTDDKASVAVYVATLIRFLREGYRPDRDIILALTADEENGDHNGVEWLAAQHRELIDAGYGLNEGGDGQEWNGKKTLLEVQASEKVYLTFYLTAENRGGHSSLPRRDNAIYELARALGRVEQLRFPVSLNEVTRTYFARMAKLQSGDVARDMASLAAAVPDTGAARRLSENPFYNARMRTTCVATMLEAGHAENALPQKAVATVNCRLLPTDTPANVQATLERAVNNAQLRVAPLKQPVLAPPSPLLPEVMSAVEKTTAAMWPGVPVVPIMGAGATDSKYLRAIGIPMFGVSGFFNDAADVRAHGRDERLGVQQFYEGAEFNYRLITMLTGGMQ